MPIPLPFTPPALSHAFQVHAATRGALQSDLAFANMFLLRRKYGTELAFEGGFLFRHFSGHGRFQGYAFPRGEGDACAALHRIAEDAALRSRPLRFCALLEDEVKVLQEVFPGVFRFVCDPGDADYLYERSQLAELPGARFHRKRGHIARWQREVTSWRLVRLGAAEVADAFSVAQAWLDGVDDASLALHHELEAISQALSLRESLGLIGAVLYAEEAPVAMCLASMISPMVVDVHYEKCVPWMRSAYPVINQGLAQMLSCRWVNREEDVNEPGLRQAKLSYFPSCVLSKFSALPC